MDCRDKPGDDDFSEPHRSLAPPHPVEAAQRPSRRIEAATAQEAIMVRDARFRALLTMRSTDRIAAVAHPMLDRIEHILALTALRFAPRAPDTSNCPKAACRRARTCKRKARQGRCIGPIPSYLEGE